jgi:hypothetical protein
VTRFLLDLDPGVQRVLDWRERAQSLRPQPRPRPVRRLAATGAASAIVLVCAHKLTENLLPWLW